MPEEVWSNSGTHEVVFTLDPSDQFVEEDELNNTFMVTYTVP